MPIPTAHSDDLLEWEFAGGSAPTLPATYYVGLLLTLPNVSGAGFVEVADAGYGRQAVVFAMPSGGAIANNADITFAQAVANYPGKVVGLGIFTAITGGSLRRWTRSADLTAVQVNQAEAYKIPAGLLRIRNLVSW